MLTEFQLGQLIAFKNEGFSGSKVQQKLLEIDCKISINQINNLYKKWIDFGGQKQPETRGRKKLFNEELIEQIKHRIRNQRTTTAVDIWRSKTLNANGASIRCVQKLLNEIGMKVRVAPSKPMLKDTNIEKRVEFGENLIEWTQDQIDQIVFTDESKLFCQKNGKHFLRINKGYKIPSKLFRKTQQFNGGIQLMVWGAISRKGPLWIKVIYGNLNAQEYKKLLKEFFKISDYNLEQNIFQQDNSKVHTSNVINKYLNNKNIDILEWPSQSPDLNPIEHVWSFLKNYLFEKKSSIKNNDDLWKQAQKGFFSDKCVQLIDQLYSTYLNRIEELLKEEGKNTSY